MGRQTQGALADAMRAAVESRRDASGRPREASGGSRRAGARATDGGPARRDDGVVLIDDSDLPPVRRRHRPRSGFGACLRELPHGWLWLGLWVLARELGWLVGLLWVTVLLSGFAVPTLTALTALAVAVGIRATVLTAGRVVSRVAGAPAGG